MFLNKENLIGCYFSVCVISFVAFVCILHRHRVIFACSVNRETPISARLQFHDISLRRASFSMYISQILFLQPLHKANTCVQHSYQKPDLRS